MKHKDAVAEMNVSSDRLVKWIRWLLRPRRWLRNAALYFLQADGIREKGKVLYYCGMEVCRVCGILSNRRVEPWSLRMDGLDIRFGPTLSDLLIYREIFIRRVYQRLPEFRPEGSAVVFDIGANIGLFTLHTARSLMGGRIYAFEPNPLPREIFNRNIVANRLKNVTLVPVALGSSPGKATLEMGIRMGLARIIDPAEEPKGGCIQVEVATLDGIVKELGVTRIDLMKIDVEGFEYKVLQGGIDTLGITHRIVLEYDNPQLRKSVTHLLISFGFKAILEYKGHIYFINRSAVIGKEGR